MPLSRRVAVRQIVVSSKKITIKSRIRKKIRSKIRIRRKSRWESPKSKPFSS
jgi:hypothetical protein